MGYHKVFICKLNHYMRCTTFVCCYRNDTEFCQSGVYTLTTDFNNGGLACGCDTDGSLSFECSNFGGQCQCRDNVIGQKCTQCREGYYGFPRCKRK